jgi:hypothetical protein
MLPPPMKCIKLVRYTATRTACYGRLTWENGECHTMEYLPRPVKNPKYTGIPAGCYPLGYRWSRRHSCKMPFVENVPDFTGIMLHTGNTLADTHGCILLGDTPDSSRNMILDSRKAFNRFMRWFAPQITNGEEIVINIYNKYEEP